MYNADKKIKSSDLESKFKVQNRKSNNSFHDKSWSARPILPNIALYNEHINWLLLQNSYVIFTRSL